MEPIFGQDVAALVLLARCCESAGGLSVKLRNNVNIILMDQIRVWFSDFMSFFRAMATALPMISLYTSLRFFSDLEFFFSLWKPIIFF